MIDIQDLIEQAVIDALERENIAYNNQYVVQLAMKVERDYNSGQLEATE